MTETEESINEWCEATFGPAPSINRIATRANEEMAELLRAISIGAPLEDIAKEAGDVEIVLNRIYKLCGTTRQDTINAAMAKNRSRKWGPPKLGCSYHIKEGAE